MMRQVTVYRIRDHDVPWILADDVIANFEPPGGQEMLIRCRLQCFPSLRGGTVESCDELLALLPFEWLELRCFRRLQIEFILPHHADDPRRHGCDQRGQIAQWHRLGMRFPIVMPFRYALQGKTAACYLPLELGEKEFREFHAFPPRSAQGRHRMPAYDSRHLGQNRSSIRGTMQGHAEYIGPAAPAALLIPGSTLLVRQGVIAAARGNRKNASPRCRSSAEPGISGALHRRRGRRIPTGCGR